MASVSVDRDLLRVRLSRGERWAALRRSDLMVPWDQVKTVETVADPFRLVRGLRAPGLALPWRAKIGTWRSHGRKTFAVTRKGRPGLRITLQDSSFDQLLLNVENPAALLQQITTRIEPPSRGTAEPVQRLVTFPAAARGPAVTLAGTVTLPPLGTAVTAASVLVGGSGPLDRDANGPRVPLGLGRDLALALAAAGIASLRYDKRGVAASGGSYLTTGFHDNVDDARAAIGSLAAQPECRDLPMFVTGHSEGAMIACALAGERGNALSGAVLLAGPAKTGEQTLIWQAAQIEPTLPKPVKLIMRLLRTDVAKQQRKALDRLKAGTADVTRMQGARVNAKWFREFMAFDPKQALADVNVPLLAITGEKDLQVDPADLEIIEATVRGPVTIERVADLTHILRRDPAAPSIRAYRKLLRQPADAQVLADISRWITSVARSSAILKPAADG